MLKGFRLAALMLLTVQGLGGCGSSSHDVASFGAESVPATPTAVQGRAQSLVPLEGATVQVYGEGEQLLSRGSLTTGDNGLFFLPVGVHPTRVVVTPPAGHPDPAPLAAEVGNLKTGYVGVNYATNLVSVYLSRHPGLTVAQAEERVRAFLLIPAGVDLGTGLDSEHYWFSRSVFARKAALRGGVEAYTASLAAQVDVGPPEPMTAEKKEEDNLATQVVKDLLGSAASSAAGPVFGWVTSAAGFNFGGPSLKQVSAQLSAIQAQLTALSAQISFLALQAQYFSDQQTLQTNDVGPIGSASQQLQNLAATFALLTPSPAAGPDQQTIEMVNTLTAPGASSDYQGKANEILNYQLARGTDQNMVFLFSTSLMENVGADGSPTYLAYPLRSNADLNASSSPTPSPSPGASPLPPLTLWNQKRNQLSYYLQVVSQAMNLIAEQAHLSTRDPGTGFYASNANAINTAKSVIYNDSPQVPRNNLLATSIAAAQQLPLPLPSDQVLVDLENGVTWYLTVMPPAQYSTLEFGNPTVTGPYGNSTVTTTWVAKNPGGNPVIYGPPAPNGSNFWVATQTELESLYHRLNAIRNKNPQQYKTNTEAMQALGWKGVGNITELKVWMYSSSYSNYTNELSLDAYTFDLNTNKTTKHNTATDHDPYHYLICLPFPGPAEKSPFNPLLANSAPGSMVVTVDSQTNPTQLTATATNSVVQSGGQFTSDNTAFDVKVQKVTRPSDDVTQDVAWYSNSPTVADVSNLVDSKGQITWHPNVAGGLTPVNFTASFLGQPSATLTVNPPSVPPVASLVRIEILPTNLLYGRPPANGINELFHATGFYSDQTAVNLDAQVNWSVISTGSQNVTVPAQQAGFTTTTPNLLVINPSLQTPNISVQANYQGVSAQAPLVVSLPLTGSASATPSATDLRGAWRSAHRGRRSTGQPGTGRAP